MYGSDAGQPPRSLYTKGLKPLCDCKRRACAHQPEQVYRHNVSIVTNTYVPSSLLLMVVATVVPETTSPDVLLQVN